MDQKREIRKNFRIETANLKPFPLAQETDISPQPNNSEEFLGGCQNLRK